MLSYFKAKGGKWAKIAMKLPGRNENRVKSRLKKLVKEGRAFHRMPESTDKEVVDVLLEKLGGATTT